MTAGFVDVRGCHVFRGEYPPQLLKLWDVFNTENESENDRPDNLPNDQKFIALEFNNGGRDLEKFVFKHGSQAFQAWKQVAHALAVAEEEMEFEHRDLHWGNVLVKETSDKYVSFSLGGDTYQVSLTLNNVYIGEKIINPFSTKPPPFGENSPIFFFFF